MILEFILGTIGLIIVIGIICAFAWYRIVSPSEAHLVVGSKGQFVVSSDDDVATESRKTYYAIPESIPFFGRAIRIMNMTIREIMVAQETIEENQARYEVVSSLKYKIKDVIVAAKRINDEEELQQMLTEVIKAGVKTVTVKYDVVKTRSKKTEIQELIRKEIDGDLESWGLELMNFQLVDFKDAKDSTIISDISKRREMEIQSTTRIENAEMTKKARVKEAEAEESSRKREIEKDKVIGEEEQKKAQKISEMEKIAQEKRFEVIKVQTIKQAEITKEQAEVKAKQDKAVAIIEAEQNKEAEKINKEQKKLEGEGDRARAEEIAKGEAAPIREKGTAEAEIIKSKGLAEAESKDALQKALNKFTPNAIQTLTAELVVDKDKAIGVETAKALKEADLKVFSGGDSDEQGFNLGKLVEATSVSSDRAAIALINKLARPNDLGVSELNTDVKAKKKDSKKKELPKKE